MEVAQVAELPDHFCPLLGRADRVIQGNQAASTAGVHQERLVVGVEQQGLVTGQGQAAVRLGRGHEDFVRTFQFVGRRQVDDRARGAQQPGQ
ncbi:hypothetical protein D3C73_852370 [compost metagenome]